MKVHSSPGGTENATDSPDGKTVARATTLARWSPAKLEADYMRRTGVQRKPTADQLERMQLVLRAFSRRDPLDGTPVLWSYPRIAVAIGLPTDGLKAWQLSKRYATRLKRTLGYLRAAGYVDSCEVAYDEYSRPVGFLVVLPAGVAQLVRATRIRRRNPGCPAGSSSPASRSFSSGQSEDLDRGGYKGGQDYCSLILESYPEGSAREAAQDSRETRERANLSADVAAALQELRQCKALSDGKTAVTTLPWLATVPADILLRESARLTLPGFDLRCSRKWQDRANRAAMLIERHAANPGMAAEWAIEIGAGDHAALVDRARNLKPPSTARTLGALARRLHVLWRLIRAHRRGGGKLEGQLLDDDLRAYLGRLSTRRQQARLIRRGRRREAIASRHHVKIQSCSSAQPDPEVSGSPEPSGSILADAPRSIADLMAVYQDGRA